MMGRVDRVAKFRREAGAGWFDTSLRAVGNHRPQDSGAIRNWLLAETTLHPTCFGCRNPFSTERRPGAFLTAVSSRSPQAGIAVAAICAECWDSMTPDAIEAAAAAVLRRNLTPAADI
jgi:hypothetical protein